MDGAGKTRNAIKADIQIVATAIAHKVDRIYTHDKDLPSICKRCGLSCSGFPEPEDIAPIGPPSADATSTHQMDLKFPEEDCPSATQNGDTTTFRIALPQTCTRPVS